MTPDHVLDWLQRHPHNHVRWLRGDKQAFGPSSTWTHIEVSNDRTSIRIPVGVWEKVRPMITVRPSADDRIYYVL